MIDVFAANLTLVKTEQEKGDRDNPSMTTYTYKAISPLVVEYLYGYDADYGENNLKIQFLDQDTQGTYLGHTRFLVDDESKKYVKLLKLPSVPLKHGCFYQAQAEIFLDYVFVSRNDLSSSSSGSAFIKNIKPLSDVKLKCDIY